MKTVLHVFLFCSFGATVSAAPKLFYPFDSDRDVTAYFDENSMWNSILTWYGYTNVICASWYDGDGSSFEKCQGTTYDGHTGTDYNVPNPGAPDYQEFTVYSAAAGMVVESKSGLGNDKGCKCYGNYVKIDHGDGWFTIYGHLKKVWVQNGQVVNVHTPLGIAGNTGVSDGDHLHFEVRMTKNGKQVAVDPYQKEYRHLWCNGKPKIYEGTACDDALWHPAGTLISPNTDDIAYLVLDNGTTIAAIPDDEQGTFTQMRYDWKNVVMVSDSELDCFQKQTSAVESVPFGFFQRSSWFGLFKKLYFYWGEPNDSKRYRVEVPKSLWNVVTKSWGFKTIPEVSTDDTLYNLYPKAAGSAKVREGTLLEDESGARFVVANGLLHYLANETFTVAGYQDIALIKTTYALAKLGTNGEGDAYAGSSFTTCGAEMCAAAQKPNGSTACVIAEVVDADFDGAASGEDCDDHDPKRNPAHLEWCDDAIDNNCNGTIDENACIIDSVDEEEDPEPENPKTCESAESCLTTLDDDCDGVTNEVGALGCSMWYRDYDGDGCGSATSAVCQCGPTPTHHLDTNQCKHDCNDSDAAIGPFNAETCGDLKDNNCNGLVDEQCGECVGVQNGAGCDDGSVCTGFDSCANGICTGFPINCNDGNECTDDACTPNGGCVFTLNYKTSCNDGNACSGNDRCIGQFCSGDAISCDDNDTCTADFCSPGQGCYHEFSSAACDDGNTCTINDACKNGVCSAGKYVCECEAHSQCNDSNECTYDSCKNGYCVHESAVMMCTSDGNECTDDRCEAGLCLHVPNFNACNDQDSCTVGDSCYAGACKSGASTCECKQDSDCGNAPLCVQYACVGNVCKSTFTAASCNDKNACTTDDHCTQGVCTGAAMVCTDNNQCTTDSCAQNQGCVFTPQQGSQCQDNDSCTTNDVCANGVCKGVNTCECFVASDCETANACEIVECINHVCVSDVTSCIAPSVETVLTNGSFESGLEGWTKEIHDWPTVSIYSDCMVATDGACSVAIANSMIQTDYHVQLVQEIVLTQGMTYKIMLDARTANFKFPMRVWIGENGSPWAVYHEVAFQVVPPWQTLSTTFTAPKDDAHAKFALVLGGVAGTLWLDNISIK